MYVSVTGLKPKGVIGWVRFGFLTRTASRSAQNAEGVFFCDFNSRNGWQHPLTVWQTKKNMMTCRVSPAHLRAINRISKVGIGKVFGCEVGSIPSWEDAFIEFDNHAREV